MSLKEKSEKLKEIVSTYESNWFLGDISFLMHGGREKAPDQLGELSSPMRQLYYLAGLNVTSDPENGIDFMYDEEKWSTIVDLLNEIEIEYQKILFENPDIENIDEWNKIRNVAVPSFLTYFNQGPLNFEEQILNWTRDLFSEFDDFLNEKLSLTTQDFIQFYENLDRLTQINFQGLTTNKKLLRPNWRDYTKIESGVDENVPDFIKKQAEEFESMSKFMIDHGMKDRFYPGELVSENLPKEKVTAILDVLSVKRKQNSFLYYTETKPGNPLYDFPILDCGDNLYQVFEIKQVIHAIKNLLERVVSDSPKLKDKYIKQKGNLLEQNIIELFKKLFGPELKIFHNYFIEDSEQDILLLWKDTALIIEAKGYNLREPFRNPEKAFPRIRDDFKGCVGYGYKQTSRVEKQFIDGSPIEIKNDKGEILEIIDTTKYENDFSIIVNLETFGLIQCDLSHLLELNNEDDVYPWAIQFDDLEIFILTLIAQKKGPEYFIDFLLFREELHGKLMCSDELEVCGGFMTKDINPKKLKYYDTLLTSPEMGNIFDDQYRITMGFKNEKMLEEKQSGKYMFW